MSPTVATITRVALLVIAFANMACSMLGIIPVEIVGDSQAYEIGSYVLTAVIAVINMWKNNSFTAEGILADQYLSQLKAASKTDTANTEIGTDI